MGDPEWLAKARAEGRVTEGPRAAVSAPPADCPEAAFTRAVIALARSHGWYAAHFRPARTKRGNWVTPVAGDGVGFPDLVLVRERVVYAELKSDTGRMRPAQREWLFRLMSANQAYFVWRPADWDDIGRVLGAAPPAWWALIMARGEG